MFDPMETTTNTPEELSSFVENMRQLTESKKTGRKVEINHSAGLITSWIINEWVYKSRKLPCHARGLFTLNEKIIVRGYDKFFNVDEVPATKYESLKKTSGPYEVTLKENGCIILISGLEDGTLVVCSKHSTGVRPKDVSKNHAVEGERQLKLQLEKIGKSMKDLGSLLYKLNVTAVAELCDDDFEEHVLEYTKDKSGLYLHGLNFNTIQFKSYPMDKVDAFAREWGFIPTAYFIKNDFDSLWDFLNKAAETGTYEGQEVEGFVIRCRENGNDFFFKYKFEEPYLLYRQFRETTRALMRGEPIPEIVAKQKKHNYIIGKYLDFTEALFEKEPVLMDQFNDNHSIIKVRKLFMEKFGLSTNNGMELLSYDKLDEQMKTLSVGEVVYKYVIVPISTIGCGKTTTFSTLTGIFPEWGHVQNDDISKSSKQKLVDRTLAMLRHRDVVFSDRNNHQFRERAQLFKQTNQVRSKYLPANVVIKFVAANFVPNDLSEEELWNVTYKRVALRGDNHQSIKFSEDRTLAESVMEGFVRRFQPLNVEREPDSNFDHVINLSLGKDSSLQNAKKILSELRIITGMEIKLVADTEFQESFEKALGYTPSFTKTFSKPKPEAEAPKKKEKKVTYYGIKVSHPKDLVNTVNGSLTSELWELLKTENLVQKEFHVTLAHTASASTEEGQKVWNGIAGLFGSPQPKNKKQKQVLVDFYCDIQLQKLIFWNKHLVCIEVGVPKFYDSEFNSIDHSPLKQTLHITLGTAGPEIKPVLSNKVLEELAANPALTELDGEEVSTQPIEGLLEKQRCFCFY